MSFALSFVCSSGFGVKDISSILGGVFPDAVARAVRSWRPTVARRLARNRAMAPSVADQANQLMVDRLIAEGALWSPALIGSFRATPRHCFLDRVFQFQRKLGRWHEIITRDPGPEEVALIYSDRAMITRLSRPGRDVPASEPEVPISSSSQPSLMAQMLEDLQLTRGLRILEVGAGTGYNAALLAHVVGPGRVTAVDVDRETLSEAWDHLRAFPQRAVRLHHADGRHGFAEAAPFDRIMVTAATPDLEPDWLDQLGEGGMLLAPLALAPGLAFIVRGTVTGGIFEGRLTRAAYFMPLRAEKQTALPDLDLSSFEGELQGIRAPWAGWFNRRRQRLRWLGFSQALAFYGLLRGLGVHYHNLKDGLGMFGVSDPDLGSVCWLGPHEWQVTGTPGRDLGRTLWRAFLDAGGPWPTEFRLRACAAGRLVPDRVEGYVRQGPHCQQIWELIEQRERPGWI
jgi:protein-L-isoaspartate(D-aspartate) O-methyltransferase